MSVGTESTLAFLIVKHFTKQFLVVCLFLLSVSVFLSDIVVGGMICRIEDDAEHQGKKKCYLMTLAVLAPYRNLGIGASYTSFLLL